MTAAAVRMSSYTTIAQFPVSPRKLNAGRYEIFLWRTLHRPGPRQSLGGFHGDYVALHSRNKWIPSPIRLCSSLIPFLPSRRGPHRCSSVHDAQRLLVRKAARRQVHQLPGFSMEPISAPLPAARGCNPGRRHQEVHWWGEHLLLCLRYRGRRLIPFPSQRRMVNYSGVPLLPDSPAVSLDAQEVQVPARFDNHCSRCITLAYLQRGGGDPVPCFFFNSWPDRSVRTRNAPISVPGSPRRPSCPCHFDDHRIRDVLLVFRSSR